MMYWVKIGNRFINLGNARQVFDHRRRDGSARDAKLGPLVVVWDETPPYRDDDQRCFYGDEADELMRHLEAIGKDVGRRGSDDRPT